MIEGTGNEKLPVADIMTKKLILKEVSEPKYCPPIFGKT
jgi:hypothetical protein|tara:strand:+ start:227 stop:343 length:117 start_codon:yes stop_codon:yes gene_type:complete